jgi:hypothetical protein
MKTAKVKNKIIIIKLQKNEIPILFWILYTAEIINKAKAFIKNITDNIFNNKTVITINLSFIDYIIIYFLIFVNMSQYIIEKV